MTYREPFEPLYSDLILEFQTFIYRVAREHLINILRAHVLAKARAGKPPFTAAEIHSLSRAIDDAVRTLEIDSLTTMDRPDVYLLVLRRVEELTSPYLASLVRLGLSRNDLDMTIFRMVAREDVLCVVSALLDLRDQIQAVAAAHTTTVMLAETHYQPAQPTNLAHYLLGWDEMLERDCQRFQGLYRRINVCPLGAAALAGTSIPMDRRYLAELLGFDGPCANTYDAIAGADWEIEMAATAATCGVNLTRMITDLITLVVNGAFELPDSLVEPSTYMPQKRNPAILEHMRGVLATVISALGSIIMGTHNIPYSDHNDFGFQTLIQLHNQYMSLQHIYALLKICLQKGAFSNVTFSNEAWLRLTTTSDLVEYLVCEKGLPFSQAETLARQIAEAWGKSSASVEAWDSELLRKVQDAGLLPEELRQVLDPYEFIQRHDIVGGPAPKPLSVLLQRARALVEEQRRWLLERTRRIYEAMERLAAEEKQLAKGLE